MATATRNPRPTKAQCFNIVVPEATPVDVIIDSFEDVVGAGGLQYLQHFGGNKFLAAVRTMALAAKLAAKGSILIANQVVPLEQIGKTQVYVTVYRLPPYVTDDALTAAFAPYGKVRSSKDISFKDRTETYNGTRLVKLEMSKPPPNFIHCEGLRVMLEYRGMKRVCSKCGAEGHFVAGCKTPRCLRCAVFGHSTEDCTAKCLKCKGDHATVDCTLPRSYALAVSPPDGALQSEFPTPTPKGSEDTLHQVSASSPETETSPDESSLSDSLPTPGQRGKPELTPEQASDPWLKNPVSQVADLLHQAKTSDNLQVGQDGNEKNDSAPNPPAPRTQRQADDNKRTLRNNDSSTSSEQATGPRKKKKPEDLPDEVHDVEALSDSDMF